MKRADSSNIAADIKLAGMYEEVVFGKHPDPRMKDTALPHAGSPFFGYLLFFARRCRTHEINS